MAKKVTLTDDQRARLAKAGVDPDRWLAEQLKEDPNLKNVDPSKWVDNHIASSGGSAQLHSSYARLPAAGEVVVTIDAAGNPVKFDKGTAPKNGVYTFVSIEQDKDGNYTRTPIGHGTMNAGKPVYSELSNDGKTFYKVTPEKNPDGTPTGKLVPADTSAQATQAGTSAAAAQPFTAPGHSASQQSNTMSPALQQQIREQYGPDRLAQIMAASQAGQPYTSPYIGTSSQSPGDTSIYKRAPAQMAPWGVAQEHDITTIDDEIKSMYQLPPDQLKDLQTKLFKGGYYGASVKLGDIPMGNPDYNTLQAYYAALADTGRRNAAGQSVSIEDVLDSGAASDVGDKNKPQYQPVDPRDVASIADQVAQQVLGRKSTPEDQRLILAALNAAGQASFTAQQNNTAATNAPTPQSVAEDVLQKQNPQEAAGYGLTQAMDVVTRLTQPSVQIAGM